MATLLLQCVAPLQSWGTQSEYIVRDTGREPSKSGIIGLLCAALGRDRAEPVDDLAALKMSIRIDREGKILRDFHTITDKTRNKPSTTLSTRYYLMDAMFLVGLEGDYDQLKRLHYALHNPHWSLFLGRKSCPPSRPPYLSNGLLADHSLDEAIRAYPWLGQNPKEHADLKRLRVVYDDLVSGNEYHHDHPVSFARFGRKFHPRRTTTTFIPCPDFDTQHISYPVVRTEKETPS